MTTVERDRLRMEMADVARERNCESRPYDSKRVHEARDVFLAIMKAKLRRVFRLVTDRITLRGRMATQQKIDPAVTFQDLTKSQTSHMTIVEIQKRQTAAFDNKSTVVESVLIGIQPEISAETAGRAVRQFNNVFKTKGPQTRVHAICSESRKNDPDGAIESPQRRIMQVIEMSMRDVNGIGVEQIRLDIDRLWKMPPGAPITRTDEPGVYEQPVSIDFYAHAGVAQYGKSS